MTTCRRHIWRLLGPMSKRCLSCGMPRAEAATAMPCVICGIKRREHPDVHDWTPAA